MGLLYDDGRAVARAVSGNCVDSTNSSSVRSNDTNLKDKPQENYARELMELFTMGVDFYTESDVYEGARVFTGWNLRRRGMQDDRYAQFFYNDRQHDTGSKSFSFAIYPDEGKRRHET